MSDSEEGYQIRTRKRAKEADPLNRMKKNLFEKVCSGRDMGFKSGMVNKNPDYIRELSLEIDRYTDALADSVLEPGTLLSDLSRRDMGEMTSFCNEKSRAQCDMDKNSLNSEGCGFLPGYYTGEPIKQFIPQLYHILQDYGFFHHYLNFTSIIDTRPRMKINKILSKWGIHLGRVLDGIDTNEGKIRCLDTMMARLRRVQFLRAFDSSCCMGGVITEESMNHDFFSIEILDTVYETLEEEKASLI